MNSLDNAQFIEVEAGVRYWEDAQLNGQEDTEGKIPCRNRGAWCPIIEIKTGKIINWVEGNSASVYYKVCDAGFYWLLDGNKNRIYKYNDYYVPNNMLCIGSNGHGDYIIFKIDQTGHIVNWKIPYIDEDKWDAVVEE